MDKLEKYIGALIDYAENELPIDLRFAVKQGASAMKRRIFNQNTGTKDVKGKGLGNYSNKYAKQRANAGYQANKKDLEVSGDLRRSIEDEGTPNGAKIFINESSSVNPLAKGKAKKPIKNQLKAGYIEKYHTTSNANDKIFALNADESELVEQTADELVLEKLTEIEKTYL